MRLGPLGVEADGGIGIGEGGLKALQLCVAERSVREQCCAVCAMPMRAIELLQRCSVLRRSPCKVAISHSLVAALPQPLRRRGRQLTLHGSSLCAAAARGSGSLRPRLGCIEFGLVAFPGRMLLILSRLLCSSSALLLLAPALRVPSIGRLLLPFEDAVGTLALRIITVEGPSLAAGAEGSELGETSSRKEHMRKQVVHEVVLVAVLV